MTPPRPPAPTYKGRPAGSFGAFSAFSFHGSKTLTTGEGGMLLVDDEAAHRRCLKLRDMAARRATGCSGTTRSARNIACPRCRRRSAWRSVERLPELISRSATFVGTAAGALGMLRASPSTARRLTPQRVLDGHRRARSEARLDQGEAAARASRAEYRRPPVLSIP